ncbi:venom carboxylesterase-6-like [Contarinia nasturtii]|uniref:venom carboxylesterase-6-like n=1 Tax=Contarinia nasturtii TaxID=265458 RepID=UPI0012D3882F|nr:venom carboxylesterase-6-like [Contarinia nasturtii]
MKLFISLCLTLFVSIYYVSNESSGLYKTAKTHDGDVRGIKKHTLFRNTIYYAFLGIPYAEKPINDLRFKAPIPIAAWKPNTLDTIEYRNSCIQQSFALGNNGPESEDCMYLNIFVPDIKTSKKLPIIFYIHGGGYSEGSGNDFFHGADFFMEQEVILVTFNYRLGAFGFMSLGTTHHSGNMGLKDQYTALKWIHHNIQAFGGDEQQITVMGQSAGAVSAHYHLLFEQSRKLIRGGIFLSGSAFLFHSYLDESSHLKKMYDFAHKFNASIQNMSELVDFVEHVPAKKIVNLTSQSTFDRTLTSDWAPVIEQKTAFQPILLKPPKDLYDSNPNKMNVSTMFGFTNYENIGLVWADVSNTTRLNKFLDEFDLVLPVHKLKPNFTSNSSYRQLLNRVKYHYMSNVTEVDDRAMQFVNMISDLNMVSPIDKTVKTQAMHSNRPTFYYQFSIDAKLNYAKQESNIKWPGANHFDDLCYIFRCHSIDSVYYNIMNTMHDDDSSKISYNTIQHMTQMFANFAKHGRPTVNGSPIRGYKPVQGHRINFLDITNNAMIPGVSPKKENVAFWHRILQDAEELVHL